MQTTLALRFPSRGDKEGPAYTHIRHLRRDGRGMCQADAICW